MVFKHKIAFCILLIGLWFIPKELMAHHALPEKAVNTGFIANAGQWLNPARFLINFNGAQVFTEPHAFQYFFEQPEDVDSYFSHQSNPHLFKSQVIRQHALRVDFLNALPQTQINGENQLSHYYNFFQGSESSLWKTKVPVYQSVNYQNLYQGIDMTVGIAKENGLKYDFIVSPKASPQQIAMRYSGAEQLWIDEQGNLHVKTSVNQFTEHKPYAYQLIGDEKIEVACAFELKQNVLTFKLGNYREDVILIIDPLLVFSTYSGSSVDNFGHTATYDNNGNLYAAGIARNATTFPNGKYPVTAGAFQTIWGGGGTGAQSWPLQDFPTDISISKYSNDGTKLLYATYLGGNKNEYPISLVVDAYEQLVVFGATLSSNFPTKIGAAQPIKSDSFDITVTRFTADGSALVGSTFLGGNGIDGINIADTLRMNYADEFRGEVQVGANGDVWLVSSTTSSNINTSSGAFQPNKNAAQDGLIYRLDSTLTTIKACSYFGQERQDALYSLDLFTNGDVVVAGGTQSLTLPTNSGYFSAAYHGGISDGFVARLNGSLTSIIGLRYWGGSDYDQAHFVKLDQLQNVVLMGQTYDSVYATPGVYRNSTGSLFITKFSPNLNTVLFSTQLGLGGKKNALAPSAFMVDVCGRIYGSVWGGSTNYFSRYRSLHPSGFLSTTAPLPVTPDAYRASSDDADFYLFVLSSNADSLKYATFFGENGGADHVDGGTSRFDKRGIVYQSVCASCAYGTSGAFPTTAGSYSPTNKSPRCSNASFKFDFRQSNVLTADFDISPRNVCGNKRVQFTNTSSNYTKSYWFINNTLVDSNTNYSDSFTVAGTYTVKLKIINSVTCNTSDSITKTFTVSPSNKASFTVIQDSCGPTVKMNGTAFTGGNIAVKYLWEFGDGDTSTQTLTPIHPYSANGTYTIKFIANPGDGCADTASQTISYNVAGRLLVASFNPATNQRCEPTQLQFRNTSENGKQVFWYINNQLVSQNLVGFDSIADKGIYRVKLIIKDSTTCKKADTTERTYYVFKELYPDFTTDVDSCVLGIQFNNTTINPTNDSVPMYWEFGDGSTSMVKSPFHRYQDTGWYDVKLTLNRGLPCETSITKKVHLEYNTRVLSARFEANPLTLCAPDTLRATNKSINAAKWYWLVNQVVEDSVNFNYTDTIINQQPYLLSLVIYNEHTCKVYDTAVFNLPVFEGAKASFEVTRDKCTPFLNIVNTSKHTTAGTGYFWSFSDGTTSTSQTPTYSSAVDTNLIITLILNPGSPCADTATKTFYYKANSQLLLVDMQVNDSTLCLPAYFNAQSTGYNGMTFTWYLNNVKVDTGLRFTDTLKTAGTYALKLVVTDTNSCIGADSLEKRIEVNEQANANFVMQRDSCSLDVTFINTSSNTQVNRIWYLGDGDSSTENIVKHQYHQTNTYTIKLITSPGNFCADTAEQIHYIDGDTAKEVFIPNVFTPNQDGYNDCFKVNGVNPKCDFYQIIVYNRWGNVVFENTDGSFCWNGNSQSGDPLPAGVYYYVLKLKKQNGLSLDEHGTVTLIREEGK